MLRHGWEKLEATLVTHRVVERVRHDVTDAGATYDVREFLVEFPGRDGSPVRLTIKEKAFKLALPDVGQPVPILVNPRRTKAAFDLDDPRINVEAVRRAEQAADKSRADERFAAASQGGEEADRRGRAQAIEAAALAATEGGGDELGLLAAMEAAEQAREALGD